MSERAPRDRCTARRALVSHLAYFSGTSPRVLCLGFPGKSDLLHLSHPKTCPRASRDFSLLEVDFNARALSLFIVGVLVNSLCFLHFFSDLYFVYSLPSLLAIFLPLITNPPAHTFPTAAPPLPQPPSSEGSRGRHHSAPPDTDWGGPITLFYHRRTFIIRPFVVIITRMAETESGCRCYEAFPFLFSFFFFFCDSLVELPFRFAGISLTSR